MSLIPSIFRLAKENSNDVQPSSIDWLELIKAVNKIQKQSCKYTIVSLILGHFLIMIISQAAAISIFIMTVACHLQFNFEGESLDFVVIVRLKIQ